MAIMNAMIVIIIIAYYLCGVSHQLSEYLVFVRWLMVCFWLSDSNTKRNLHKNTCVPLNFNCNSWFYAITIFYHCIHYRLRSKLKHWMIYIYIHKAMHFTILECVRSYRYCNSTVVYSQIYSCSLMYIACRHRLVK